MPYPGDTRRKAKVSRAIAVRIENGWRKGPPKTAPWNGRKIPATGKE
ncbi:MAG: hypothetical protein Q7R86_01825 [bacterium]|nr:hypothetical protein [bacterium]